MPVHRTACQVSVGLCLADVPLLPASGYSIAALSLLHYGTVSQRKHYLKGDVNHFQVDRPFAGLFYI